MATKIRLQRHGRKGYAFYKIVVADSRAPRDGKFIERIERALYWIGVGAQPTDTARNILSREGVLMMKHLLGGVKKGAFDQAAAESKFEAWLKGKKDALNNMKAKVKEAAVADNKVKLEAEKAVNKARAEAVAEKKAAEAKAKAESEAAAAAEEATETEETPVEAAAEEAPAAESAE